MEPPNVMRSSKEVTPLSRHLPQQVFPFAQNQEGCQMAELELYSLLRTGDTAICGVCDIRRKCIRPL